MLEFIILPLLSLIVLVFLIIAFIGTFVTKSKLAFSLSLLAGIIGVSISIIQARIYSVQCDIGSNPDCSTGTWPDATPNVILALCVIAAQILPIYFKHIVNVNFQRKLYKPVFVLSLIIMIVMVTSIYAFKNLHRSNIEVLENEVVIAHSSKITDAQVDMLIKNDSAFNDKQSQGFIYSGYQNIDCKKCEGYPQTVIQLNRPLIVLSHNPKASENMLEKVMYYAIDKNDIYLASEIRNRRMENLSPTALERYGAYEQERFCSQPGAKCDSK